MSTVSMTERTVMLINERLCELQKIKEEAGMEELLLYGKLSDIRRNQDVVVQTDEKKSAKLVSGKKKMKKKTKKKTRDAKKAEREAIKIAKKAVKEVEKMTLKAEKLTAKEVEKAEKKAAKEAVKEAEKAEKKAAKEAEKAEKKAAREAEKAEKKAAREAEKAEKKAARESEKAKKKVAKEKLKFVLADIKHLAKLYDPSIDGPRRFWDHEDGPDDLEEAITLAEEIEERAGLVPCGVRNLYKM